MTPDLPRGRYLVTGATGLVGRHALDLALADPAIERVVAPTRRPLPPHPRLEAPQVDWDALPLDAPWWRVRQALIRPWRSIAAPVVFVTSKNSKLS